MINAYRLLAQQCDYPLHLGVTEAGPAFQGTVKVILTLRRRSASRRPARSKA